MVVSTFLKGLPHKLVVSVELRRRHEEHGVGDPPLDELVPAKCEEMHSIGRHWRARKCAEDVRDRGIDSAALGGAARARHDGRGQRRRCVGARTACY